VRFWNIRAADIQLYFVDLVHLPRYAAVMPELGRRYARTRHAWMNIAERLPCDRAPARPFFGPEPLRVQWQMTIAALPKRVMNSRRPMAAP
jgi:hypothetical protein